MVELDPLTSPSKGSLGGTTLAYCTIDDHGSIVSYSHNLAGALGRSTDVTGVTLSDLLDGWETLPTDTGIPTLARGGGDDRRVIEIHSCPSPGGGHLLALVDVTAHEAIRSELSDLAEFPRKNPGPVVWLDRSGTVLRSNPAALELFGADLSGTCWFDRCPGLTEDEWTSSLADGVPFDRDVDVEGRCFSMAYVPSDDGRFVFSFGSDITTVRQAERRLAEVARFPDMNPGPVLRLDMDASILMANRAARTVFGDDIEGANWMALVPEIASTWAEISGSEDLVQVEIRLDGRDYQFTHRHDPEAGLVFCFGADITDQKKAERGIQQADRMATLGTLAAGVAHELNNPAAAARRAADQMKEAFGRLQDAQRELDAFEIDADARERLRAMDEKARETSARPPAMDPMTRSDQEADLEDWFDDHGVSDEYDLAPMLVEQEITPEVLDEWLASFGDELLEPVLGWAAAVFPVYRLAHEVGQAAARISEIVGAMKSYSYLGQAPRQPLDLHEGIDNTLVILRNKLKVGIEVKRDYAPSMPKIPAYGGELNQVWTNLIDNAADAMGGKGVITISTSLDGDHAVVEICDDGPGIPEDVIHHVFDPFFTTKDPGKGTGLGLATTYSIVTEKHRGSITVGSEPGRTCFTIRLPCRDEED